MKDLEIRRDGTIYHKRLKRHIAMHDNGRGYLCFGYKGKTYRLHRVIAEKFCKRKHKLHTCVLHKNHKKHDCRASNLRWGTLSDNLRDAHKAGSMEHSRKRRPVKSIQESGSDRVLTFMSINHAARFYGTSRANIGSVLKGKSRTAAGLRWEYA